MNQKKDIKFFQKNGYSVFPNFYNEKFCFKIEKNLEIFLKKKLPEMPKNQIYYDLLNNFLISSLL